MSFLHYWDYKYIYKIYNKSKTKNDNMYNKKKVNNKKIK